MSAMNGFNIDEALSKYSDARVRLNAFHAVIELLEGGTLPGGCNSTYRTAAKIIDLCKAENQRQLKIQDRASAKIKSCFKQRS